jgi:cbb3-type cytochrome oxidase subunit 3
MQDVVSFVGWFQQYSVVLMFVVFTGLMVTVFWPGRRDRFERDAQIPLHDDR